MRGALDDARTTKKAQAENLSHCHAREAVRPKTVELVTRAPDVRRALICFHISAPTNMISTRWSGVFALAATALFLERSPRQTAAAPPESMFRGGPAHHGVYSGGGPTLVGLAWRAPTDGDVT